MRTLIFISTLAIILCACNLSSIKDAINESSVDKTKFKKIVQKDYSLMVPEFTTPTTKLHNTANVQYADVMKEFYVIVINESKDQLQQLIEEKELMLNYFPEKKLDVNSYYNFVKNGLLQRGENISLFDSASFSAHNLNTKVVSASGTLKKDNKIFYRIAAIEGKNQVYQVFTWTLAKYKDTYQPVMDSIIRSVVEYN